MFNLLSLISLLAAQVIAPVDTPKVEQDSLPPLTEEIISESPQARALADIQTYLKRVKSLEADFSQMAPNGNITQGKMYMQRPGKIRFDYGKDAKLLVVSDGKTLSMIDYEIGQVTRWPVKDTPLNVILGETMDFKGMRTRIVPTPDGQEDTVALMAEDPKKPEMGVITVYFREMKDSKTKRNIGLMATHWVVLDAQGQVTRIALSNQQVNKNFDDTLWAYKDPRGSAKRRRLR